MANRELPTAEQVCQCIEYDPETGIFTRLMRERPSGITDQAWAATLRFMGKPTGSLNKRGYVNITVFGHPYQAHRLAFLMVNRSWPKGEVDHINGDTSDNSWGNLREATRSENCQNRVGHKYTGTRWSRSNGAWIAEIGINGVRRYLGTFQCRDEAANAYREAKANLHTFQPEVREVSTCRGLDIRTRI